MKREKMIDFIINNSFRYSEQNRDLLESLDNGDLEAIVQFTLQDVKNQIRNSRSEIAISL